MPAPRALALLLTLVAILAPAGAGATVTVTSFTVDGSGTASAQSDEVTLSCPTDQATRPGSAGSGQVCRTFDFPPCGATLASGGAGLEQPSYPPEAVPDVSEFQLSASAVARLYFEIRECEGLTDLQADASAEFAVQFAVDTPTLVRVELSRSGGASLQLSLPGVQIPTNGTLVQTAIAEPPGFSVSGQLSASYSCATYETCPAGDDTDSEGIVVRFEFEEPPELAPVVFVPGVAGSVLSDDVQTTFWFTALPSRIRQLSLFPEDAGQSAFEIRASDALRYVGGVLPIYGPFLEKLEASGYVPYVLSQSGLFLPERLTTAGCDLSQDDGSTRPDLFVFPYDWRRSNAENAALLADYVGCVRQFHPTAELTIVAHSMGSLLSRRYLLDTADDLEIDELVTIGGPFLGAPKLVYVFETGDFLHEAPFLKSAFQDVLGSMPGPHQLLPSRAYFDLAQELLAAGDAEEVFVEVDRDVNLDGTFTSFDYDQLIAYVDIAYGRPGFRPGSNGDAFHQGGQDDWRADPGDVEYHHVMGRQFGRNTIGGVRATFRTECTLFGTVCTTIPTLEPVLTYGDGTVPLVSAERRGIATDLNAPSAEVQIFNAASARADDAVEHNGLMSYLPVQEQVLAWLRDAPGGGGSGGTGAGKGGPPTLRAWQVIVSGVAELVIRDGLGNTTEVLGAGIHGTVPGVVVYELGESVFLASVPQSDEDSFELRFEAGTAPIGVELLLEETNLLTGVTQTVRAIRYRDLVLTPGADAKLAFLPLDGAGPLEIDDDGNGSYETQLVPIADVAGSAALDDRGPAIEVDDAPGPGDLRTVTLSATDVESGVSELFYSLDGTSYEDYLDPLELDPQQTPVVYAFAQDGLANRSAREYRFTVPEPGALATATAALVAVALAARRRRHRRRSQRA